MFIKSDENPAAKMAAQIKLATRISSGSTAVGSDQGGVRSYNDRVVIQTLRALANASRAEIARATQLTAQTVAVITDRLMGDGLVMAKGRKYGGLGQPSKQLALNPDGAYAIGVKVGRRGVDVVAIDFVGDLVLDQHSAITFSDPDKVFKTVVSTIDKIRRRLGERWHRVTGIGIATPFNPSVWNVAWDKQPGASDDAALYTWNHLEIGTYVHEHFQRPTFVENDGTAAATAELVFGRGRQFDNFFYIYLGTALGGGIVLNGRSYRGITSNAGDFALMPVAADPGQPNLLIDYVSHAALSSYLGARGITDVSTRDLAALYRSQPAIFDDWLDTAANALVAPLLSVICLLDTQALVFGGRLPRVLTEVLAMRTDRLITAAADKRLRLPAVCVGEIDDNAPAFGAAMLPFYADFAPDRELL